MDEIREGIIKTVQDLYDLKPGLDFAVELTPSPENISADFSSNLPLKLAKPLHESPLSIAEALSQKLQDSALSSSVSVSVSRPGFLNFTLSPEYLKTKIAALAQDFEKGISWDKYAGQTVICEFSDPNPFKVLHVGHLYTSIVGDSISRLFAYAGAKVIRANFGGDVGLHVAKTMYALEGRDPATLGINDIADCYVKGTAAYEDDPAAKQDITKLNKEIYHINAENLHDSPLARLYWRGRELSYAYFQDFYASIGIKFDKFYPESTVAALGLAKVKEELSRGVYELSDGAVVFKGEEYGLHTRVFINREGVPTYETKDVGLIFTKEKDYHFDKSIVITGNEQLEYMKVVLKSVEQYAPELVEKTSHLTHGLVKLPGNVKMSSRKGNFLKAVDVLDLVRIALKKGYDSDDQTIALAATKYAFLKYKMGANIIFDPEESVKMTGSSGPYLLYSCVRAKKILQKAEGASKKSQQGALEADNPYERSLVKKLLCYQDVLRACVEEIAPHKLANYLYELAQEFSRFYEHCEVVGSAAESERLQLVRIYLETMTHGLDLLGINIPEEM